VPTIPESFEDVQTIAYSRKDGAPLKVAKQEAAVPGNSNPRCSAQLIKLRLPMPLSRFMTLVEVDLHGPQALCKVQQ
jgi:hypothetical protein